MPKRRKIGVNLYRTTAELGTRLAGAALRRAATNALSRSTRLRVRSSTRRRRGTARYVGSRPMLRYKGPLTKKVISKKLNAMCEFMQQQTAVHIHRHRGCNSVQAAAHQAGYAEINNGGTLTRHEAAMGNLRFFDPATNSLVLANVATGTYHRDILMKITRDLHFRNNYHVPANVMVWSCTPKKATNTTAINAINRGLFDQGGVASSSPLVYPRDSKEFRDIWRPVLLYKGLMQPGQEKTVKANTDYFKYNFSTNDNETESFQPRQGGHVFLIRIVGVLGHDSVQLTEHTDLPCGLDFMVKVNYVFKYDAGKDLHDISIEDNCATVFSNVGRVSQRARADQQNYLV